MKLSALLTVDESTGEIECLWTDKIALEQLGTLHVRRASNIEFNNDSQLWEVKLADKPDVVAYSATSRDSCITWEVNEINKQLLAK